MGKAASCQIIIRPTDLRWADCCILIRMENWQLFRDPRFAVQFRYPAQGTDGEPVERVETVQEGMLRVHVLAPKSREVYFEVTKYDQLSAQAEYQRPDSDTFRVRSCLRIHF